ncbi:hypothetical protein [Nocardioides yefusunii]|uniref:Uncharacterized protein n=1 Tax=Nocardioides yefusunii TaxID=2500546 RepID=A0ABW1QUY7_9ACTN|nr:hypothetical protein [Nocardioides yefusunii]
MQWLGDSTTFPGPGDWRRDHDDHCGADVVGWESSRWVLHAMYESTIPVRSDLPSRTVFLRSGGPPWLEVIA